MIHLHKDGDGVELGYFSSDNDTWNR